MGDPLTGSQSAPDGSTAGAEAVRDQPARHLASEEGAAPQRQHTARVPRYTGSAGQGVVTPPSAEAPGDSGPPTVVHPIVSESGTGGIPPSLAPMLSHDDQPVARHTDPASARTYQASPQTGYGPPAAASGGGVTRTGSGTGGQGTPNPAVRVAVVLLTLLAAVPAVLVLYQALFQAEVISTSGAIAGTLMLIGLPMSAAGLLPVIGGDPAAAQGQDALLRPPLLYLTVGTVLLLAAGAAAA